jgi:polyisoprenoid-binding protein YceI
VARYRIIPERSWVEIRARSNVHPIETRTVGLEGLVQLVLLGDGRVDLTSPPSGTLALRVEKLSSGNPLQDRELRRRIDARRHPTIDGALVDMRETTTAGRYVVRGDVTFRGVTRTVEDEMTLTIAADRSELELEGETTFDVRDFGMDPPKILLFRVEPGVRVKAHIVVEPIS